MPDKFYTLQPGPKNVPPENQVIFLVQGSDPRPYRVTFSKQGINLTAHCTCRAGIFGQYCKHRLDILSGEIKKTKLVSANIEDIALVGRWVKGSDVERALGLFHEAQQAADEATALLREQKKKLARALMD